MSKFFLYLFAALSVGFFALNLFDDDGFDDGSRIVEVSVPEGEFTELVHGFVERADLVHEGSMQLVENHDLTPECREAAASYLETTQGYFHGFKGYLTDEIDPVPTKYYLDTLNRAGDEYMSIQCPAGLMFQMNLREERLVKPVHRSIRAFVASGENRGG